MMYRRLILVVVILSLALQSGRSQVASPPAEHPKSEARGVLKISLMDDYESHVGLIITVLQTESLQRKAIEAALKKLGKEVPAELPEAVVIASHSVRGEEVQVQSFDERLPAASVLEALKDVLTPELFSLDATRTFLVNQISNERNRGADLAAKLSAERDDLTKLAVTAGVELDPAVAVQKRIRLETEWQILKVEAQGIVARKDAIEHQIAELAKKASEGASSTNRIQVELMKSIDARRRVVESRQAQFAAGGQGSSLENVEQAKDQLAQAEVELAKYRRTLADAAGGQRMADLQRRLDDTAIDLVETTTKLRAIEKLADQARQHSAEVEAKRIEVELLEQDYRRARDELSQLESKLRQHVSPSVTLIPLS